jgi:hypothetical protein
MSQIWPDVPELADVPEVLRSGIWMQAYTHALRSWQTRFIGAGIVVGLGCAGGLAVVGRFGPVAAFVAGFAGGILGIMVWVRYVLPWRARKMVPEVRGAAGWPVDGGPAQETDRTNHV